MQQITGENPCRNAISRKLIFNFIEIALRHGCSPVNLLHIFRTPFLKNTSGWLPLILPNISLSKGKQPMKFGQVLEYNKKNTFPQKSCRKRGRETIFRSLFVY